VNGGTADERICNCKHAAGAKERRFLTKSVAELRLSSRFHSTIIPQGRASWTSVDGRKSIQGKQDGRVYTTGLFFSPRDLQRIQLGRTGRAELNGEIHRKCGDCGCTYSTSSPRSNMTRSVERSCGIDGL